MAENVLYQAHPSMIRNHPMRFVLLLLALAGCIFGWIQLSDKPVAPYFFAALIVLVLLVYLVWWFRCLGEALIVTDERVTMRTGILSKHTNDLYHTDVRNVRVNQTFGQRIFGVGQVLISSAGTGGMEIDMSGLPNPNKIKYLIDTYRRGDAQNGNGKSPEGD